MKMQKIIIGSIVALAVLVLTSDLHARGQMPLPPAFAGGNAGAWLGRGPLFGFDSLMNGPGDWGGGSDGGSGGSGGGASGYYWDPLPGATGGTGNDWPGMRGDCWGQMKPGVQGPPEPLCDCAESVSLSNYLGKEVGYCDRVEHSGSAADCTNHGQNCTP